MRRCLTLTGSQRCFQFFAQALDFLLKPLDLASLPLNLLLSLV
jgi:hypothetical protein